MSAVVTVAQRRRKLDAMIEELVEQGVPRADAVKHVRETALHEFDVIEDTTPSRRRPRRAAAPGR